MREMEEPALPVSEPAPWNPEPGLLPESSELPARPSVERPAPLNRMPSSEESQKGNRFDEVRALAMGSRRAVYLRNRARRSSSSSSRRIYLRAYYVAVASRMRQLDPKLKSSIDAYEKEKIHEVSGSRVSSGRSSASHSKLHRTVNRETHHRSHRVSSRSRYRRIRIIDEDYGPPFPPFPPFGPPVVFDPW